MSGEGREIKKWWSAGVGFFYLVSPLLLPGPGLAWGRVGRVMNWNYWQHSTAQRRAAGLGLEEEEEEKEGEGEGD